MISLPSPAFFHLAGPSAARCHGLDFKPVFMKKTCSALLRLLFFALAVLLATPLVRGQDGLDVKETDAKVIVTWPMSKQLIFNLDETKPLIAEMAVHDNGTRTVVARNLQPVTLLTVGSRNLDDPAGWVAFFDNPPKRPHQTFPVVYGKRSLKVERSESRAVVTIAEASAGSFHGELRFTFFNGGLFLVETVLSTEEDGRAILYDTGLTSADAGWKSLAWKDANGGTPKSGPVDVPAENLAVAGRTITVDGYDGGSLAIFPAPHRFFFPQDEAFNLKFIWRGRDYGGKRDPGFGIRQHPEGDGRWVPWFNAPPGTKQELGAFYLLSKGDAKSALDAVAKYTRGDHYEELPGRKTFTSHYHIEHTMDYLQKQKEQKTTGVPKGLESPNFLKTFKARGINIVHLAEFHAGPTPKLRDDVRLPQLKTLHDECARLSDKDLLLLPGEEPNVHLGGHWISFFPKPVYWVLNREAKDPFVQQSAEYGQVYHVGGPDDVLKLMEKENGLMWTAHPRIKASIGFPDDYKTEPFFASDHFYGGAWKAMPADLSRPTLGWRVLDLLDDMCNWGFRKHAHSEADLFKMEPESETYAHLNINYLKLDKLPAFKDGWQPVLDALRKGDFFSTTGEILIPDFTIDGKHSGEEIAVAGPNKKLQATLDWTFPLAFADVISGDGKKVYHQRIDLSDTGEFGAKILNLDVDLTNRTWVRFEVWDVACNGAYTQPIWIGPQQPIKFPEETNGRPISKEKLGEITDVIAPAARQPAMWKWTVSEPSAEWAKPGFDASAWQEGKSAFGTATTPGTDGILNTVWNTKDIWIRREVQLPAQLGENLKLLVHHDNKAEVYIDGELAWKAVDIETRDYQVFHILPDALAKLKPGAKITLAAHGHNGQGGQVLDVGIVNVK